MTLLDALTTSPQTKRQLASRLGWTPREVELAVNAARLAGAAILSSGDGYRLAVNAAEAKACALRLRRRALGQLATAAALDDTAARMAAAEHRRPAWPAWDAA